MHRCNPKGKPFMESDHLLRYGKNLPGVPPFKPAVLRMNRFFLVLKT
jgi:hypothetical protein